MTDKTKTKPLTCSICFQPIPPQGTWLHGNNAQPINDGRCCKDCDDTIVIPARITLIMRARTKS